MTRDDAEQSPPLSVCTDNKDAVFDSANIP